MPAKQPGTPVSAAQVSADRAALRTWATVFEKPSWSTGSAEICSTLQNISDTVDDTPEALDEATSALLRRALQTSAMLADAEIMHGVRLVREAYPPQHWWWWPEAL